MAAELEEAVRKMEAGQAPEIDKAAVNRHEDMLETLTDAVGGPDNVFQAPEPRAWTDERAAGMAQMRERNFVAAAACFSRALEAKPDSHILLSCRSEAHLGMLQLADALADADRAVELRADWPKGHLRRAAALEAQNRMGEAAQAYEAAGQAADAARCASADAARAAAHPWDDGLCDECQAPGAESRCGRCRKVRYCSRDCQRAAWQGHRRECEGEVTAGTATQMVQALGRSSGALTEAGPGPGPGRAEARPEEARDAVRKLRACVRALPPEGATRQPFALAHTLLWAFWTRLGDAQRAAVHARAALTVFTEGSQGEGAAVWGLMVASAGSS